MVFDQRNLILAVLAVLFLAVTTATWAGVTGPGTTGSEPQAPAPETTVPAPDAGLPAPGAVVPEPHPAPSPTEQPPATSEVPEAPPFEAAARDLGEREQAQTKNGDRKAAKAPPAGGRDRKGGGSDWKAAKKAAKADCKRRFTGRERGQCISAAARGHKNPKARGRR